MNKFFSFMQSTRFHYFLAIYCVLLFINAIFPTQSDDLGAGYTGFKGAYDSYMTWNGRFGELLRVSFGSYIGEMTFFPFLNAFLGTYFIFCVFFIFMGRLPRGGGGLRYIDFSILLIIIFMVMYHVSFGSIFIWVCGTFNYLWAYCFIVTYLLPYRAFWERHIRQAEYNKSSNPLFCIFIAIIGFIAGWSSEFGIALFILQCIAILYAKYKRIKLPLWYYIGSVTLLIGWIILFLSPGSATRMQIVLSMGDAYTLSQLWHMSFVEKILRINEIFKTNTLFFALIMIITYSIHIINMHKSTKLKILYFLLGAGCIIGFKEANNLLFMLASVLICCYAGYTYKNNGNILESRAFFIMAGLFAIYMLYNSTLIQLGSLSGRAQLHYNILRMAMISTLFFYFANKFNISRICFYILNTLCLFYASFVIWAYVDMSFKWHNMIGFIEGQKLAGEKHIVVDKDTFSSFYRMYGDWSNPTDDPSEWPNTSYAYYFGVDTFSAR